MKTIQATLEKTQNGSFCVYCKDEMFSGVGDTADQAKSDMATQIADYIDFCKESGKSYPSWLDEEYQFTYQFDVQSLLQYYTGIITPTALGRITGINPKQLWSYAHGKTTPRKSQIEKIEKGIHALAAELSSVSLL